MITSKDELKTYLLQDKIALHKKNCPRPALFGDEVWKWEIVYRKYEYYTNCRRKNILTRLGYLYYKLICHNQSLKLGFSIPVNVFGPGLSIAHYGTITVNENVKVGKNCRIHENVTIGATSGSKQAPILGDNIFLGSGSRVIGNVQIGDDIAIGAGCVVVRSFTTPGITLGGGTG
jgi:serine O-acetyltransferase